MYMKLREDQEKVRTLLCDTVTLLCKNGLSFSKELRVEGLLGITLDQTEVFIVHINEKLYSDDINGVVKDSAQHQKTRKRGHLDNDAVEVSPPKKQNHIGATDYSLSGKTDLYDTFNNNVADPFTKCPKQEPEDERENNAFIEDDRNAMRFCYNLENEEDESAHDIPEGGTGSVQGKSHPTMEVSAPSIVKEESHSPGGSNSSTGCGEDPLNELKPPDPSMGGPFITGIVNNNMEIHSAANEDDEEDDKAWNELPQLGTLIHDSSSLVPEGGTWTTTSVGGATGKGRRQGKSPDSLLYLAQYPDSDHQGSPQLKSKEGRRSWTSKNKPYACKVPGCNKSYFFIHDLRRHERQKHADVITTLSSSNGQDRNIAGNGDSDTES